MVADNHSHATDKIGVDCDSRLEFEAEFLFESNDKVLHLSIRQRIRAGDLCKRSAFELILQQVELLGNFGQDQGGSVEANITRWLGQLSQADFASITGSPSTCSQWWK